MRKLDQANQALGRLDGLTSLLPEPQLFIYFYIRKEAVVSSQIEGTQSSLSDLLMFELDEAPGVPLDDVVEVSSYVAAMNHGLERLRGGFPLSARLIREVHGVLLRHGRGADKAPGEFRRSQNWIGGSRPGNAFFVPPPANLVPDCIGDLERFLHDERSNLPLLVRAALAHVQFETIHPFLDGNGRVGRLLITLLLCAEGVLSEPLLYLSLFLKTNRSRYYELLQRCRTRPRGENGSTSSWPASSIQPGRRRRPHSALCGCSTRIGSSFAHRAASPAACFGSTSICGGIRPPLRGVRRRRPGLPSRRPLRPWRRSVPQGCCGEITGRRRDRVFAYRRYLDLLAEGTEPLPR